MPNPNPRMPTLSTRLVENHRASAEVPQLNDGQLQPPVSLIVSENCIAVELQ